MCCCFSYFSPFTFQRVDQSFPLLSYTVHLNLLILYWVLSFIHIFQCDTSAQGGSPTSTLTCSTASPCSGSPSSTLSTSAGGQSLSQPLSLPSPHCGPSISPSGTLPSPAPSPAPGSISGSSPGPPSQSPTSTLESKDSGIIGECCCCVFVENSGHVFKSCVSTLYVFRLLSTLDEACPIQKLSHASLGVKVS